MRKFKTESQRLLNLMVNSIYTNHEIFLRELISNASDALDKLHLESLTDHSISSQDLGIQVAVDKDRRLLTISDNGIGMNKDELDKNLGTIAHSGSVEFKEKLAAAEGASPVDIIGQFGVGFYSAFMVADKVTVVSRSYRDDTAYQWESDGVSGYSIKAAERPKQGTDIILHLRASSKEENLERYLDQISLQALIRHYSNYIRYPISMEVTSFSPKSGATQPDQQTEYEPVTETKVINSMVPIWTRKKSEVSQEDYNEFYKSSFHDIHDPLRTISVHAEGTLEYTALLFIPQKAPEYFYSKDLQTRLALYSSNVLITDKCTKLLPEHFGFVRGVVDSKDLNLNISREVLQQDHQLEAIGQRLEKKIKGELEDLRDKNRESYAAFFEQFGLALKYAIYSSHGVLTESLQDLLLFYSAREKRQVSLAEYVAAAGEAEKAKIYYATGDDIQRLALTPSVQAVLSRGHDVLLCPGGIQDEFCFMAMGAYKGTELCNVASGNLDLGSEQEKDGAKQANEEHSELFAAVAQNLPSPVARVIASTRLRAANDAASCVSTDGSLSIAVAKFLATRPELENAPKPEYILEINTQHKLFAGLQAAFQAQDEERVKNYATVLLDQALLAEDIAIDDPIAFNTAINSLIE